jgi:hypothetical protein
VDSLGGFGSALARARELAGLPIEADLVIVPHRPSGLLDYLLASRDAAAQAKGGGLVPAALRPFLAQLYLLSHVGAREPLALYEGPPRLE